MTQEEIITKIRLEIERMRRNNEIKDTNAAQYEYDVACGYENACEELLSFLNTFRPELID